MEIEKTVFISYRRTHVGMALAICNDLKAHGFDVFFDYESIQSGDFKQIIIDQIVTRAHFIILLTPTALARCIDPNDLFRREIETAITSRRNIVPITFENFSFKDSELYLKGILTLLSQYNAMDLRVENFTASMSRLREKFLNITLDKVKHPPIPPTSDYVFEMVTSRLPKPLEENLTAVIWFQRGLLDGKLGNYALAILEYDEAILLDSNYVVAYFNRGWNKERLGDLTGAIKDYSKSIELDPKSRRGYHKRGFIYLTQGNYKEAIKDCSEAILIDPKDVESLINRCSARGALGDFDGAISDATKAIKIDKSYYEAYLNRASAYFMKGEIEKAIRDYGKVIQMNSNFSSAYYSRAIAHEKNRDFRRALSDLQKYIDLNGEKIEEVTEYISELTDKLNSIDKT